MDPSEIPRPQSARVALYEQTIGRFDPGKNAYWSLRKGRAVTLAEGARFDTAMRAGGLAPVVRRSSTRTVRGVGTLPSRTGATSYRVAARLPRSSRVGPPPMRNGFSDQVAFRGGRMGWWRYPSGKLVKGRQLTPPSRTAGLRWSFTDPRMVISDQPAPMVTDMRYRGGPFGRFTPPQEKLLHMPTEAKRIDALPTSPRPGPARPPAEPLWDAIKRQIQEKRAGPALRPDFARPALARPAPIAVAGFPMKKLALPLALIAGAFVVSKLV